MADHQIRELDSVRVLSFTGSLAGVIGSKAVRRLPRVGDVGTVVHADPRYCTVESVNADGLTVWLADFRYTEVEFLPRPGDNAGTSTVLLMNAEADKCRPHAFGASVEITY